ncbi:hypothetical protein L2E82_11654 [Cichorium intybus]|uniref:Uncharacterized protein n=1 Tax=Cichorium intybus TaxID=13427 RepID=A0ACB9GDX3_CICIN|nr:hypothetical protein L2E82_11654 [Cichorium intybus]
MKARSTADLQTLAHHIYSHHHSIFVSLNPNRSCSSFNCLVIFSMHSSVNRNFIQYVSTPQFVHSVCYLSSYIFVS